MLSRTLEEGISSLRRECTETPRHASYKMCDQPGRNILYWMEIKDATNMRLGIAWVLETVVCMLAFMLVASDSEGFPPWVSRQPVFKIRPWWQSDHKTICQSAVVKGCLLGCDWSAKVPLFPLDQTPPGFWFSSCQFWWISRASPLEKNPNISNFLTPFHQMWHIQQHMAITWAPTCCNHLPTSPPQLQFQEVKAESCQPITAKDNQLIKS